MRQHTVKQLAQMLAELQQVNPAGAAALVALMQSFLSDDPDEVDAAYRCAEEVSREWGIKPPRRR